MSHRLFVSLIIAGAVAALLLSAGPESQITCDGAPLCAAPTVTSAPLAIDPQS